MFPLKTTFIYLAVLVLARAEDIRLNDLDPNEAKQVIEQQDQSLKYAPKVESSVPAVRVLGNEPTNVLEDIYLANQHHGQDGLGGYLYGYQVPDIAKNEKKDAHGPLKGAYNYINGQGQEIKVQYWDNGDGFHQEDNVGELLEAQKTTDSPEVKAAKDAFFKRWNEEAERNTHPIVDPNNPEGSGNQGNYDDGRYDDHAYDQQASGGQPGQNPFSNQPKQTQPHPFQSHPNPIQNQQHVGHQSQSSPGQHSVSQFSHNQQPTGHLGEQQQHGGPIQTSYQQTIGQQPQYTAAQSQLQQQYSAAQSKAQQQFGGAQKSTTHSVAQQQYSYIPPAAGQQPAASSQFNSYNTQYQPAANQQYPQPSHYPTATASQSHGIQSHFAQQHHQQATSQGQYQGTPLQNHNQHEEQNQGPPKGFFYKFDYPVGIIVDKQGRASGGVVGPSLQQPQSLSQHQISHQNTLDSYGSNKLPYRSYKK